MFIVDIVIVGLIYFNLEMFYLFFEKKFYINSKF